MTIPVDSVLTLDLLCDAEAQAQLSAVGLSTGSVCDVCKLVLDHQELMTGLNGRLELSLSLVPESHMQQLNGDYRDQCRPTNVLSFPSDMPPLTEPTGVSLTALGDLVFCPAVIEQEAAAQNKKIAAHWIHLLVHGTLHLCGYDHISDVEAAAMESLEIQILSRLGISNPYQV